MHRFLVIFSVLFVSLCGGAKLPSTFKKCKRESSDCIAKAVEDALHQLTTPKEEVGLPSLNPLEIPALTIGAGSGPVAVQQNFKNLKIFGFTKAEKCKFEITEKNVIRIECTFPELKMEAQYDLNGKILLLPVYGKGPSTITLENLRGIITFDLEEYEKQGTKHFKIVGSKLELRPELVKFNFGNLFDGDKALGDNINQVINDNWKEVFDDIKASYEEAFDKIIADIFGKLLTHVSVSELFDE